MSAGHSIPVGNIPQSFTTSEGRISVVCRQNTDTYHVTVKEGYDVFDRIRVWARMAAWSLEEIPDDRHYLEGNGTRIYFRVIRP